MVISKFLWWGFSRNSSLWTGRGVFPILVMWLGDMKYGWWTSELLLKVEDFLRRFCWDWYYTFGLLCWSGRNIEFWRGRYRCMLLMIYMNKIRRIIWFWKHQHIIIFISHDYSVSRRKRALHILLRRTGQLSIKIAIQHIIAEPFIK